MNIGAGANGSATFAQMLMFVDTVVFTMVLWVHITSDIIETNEVGSGFAEHL